MFKNENFPASDGKQIRDFCFIEDAIKAIDLALRIKPSGELINVGYGKGISMKKLIRTIKKIAKVETNFGMLKSRNHENQKLVPSIIKSKKILGLKLKLA